jgi:hypothetical protein
MRFLLTKGTEFIWYSAQDQAFNKVKKVFTTSPVLAYFDPSKPITLQVDASQKKSWCHPYARGQANSVGFQIPDTQRTKLLSN